MLPANFLPTPARGLAQSGAGDTAIQLTIACDGGFPRPDEVGALAPMFWVVQMRGKGHKRTPFTRNLKLRLARNRVVKSINGLDSRFIRLRRVL